ncbi:MAG: helix-turn-helix domain-containing protein [Acidobacteriota bacterium]
MNAHFAPAESSASNSADRRGRHDKTLDGQQNSDGDKETNEITHVITFGEDVTMRVEAIHAAGRAEKLAAIGRLAAGVVHEINNPLATISACSESLESRVSEGVYGESEDVDDLREYLGLIRSKAFCCKSITNGLLDFSRGRTGNRFLINIAEVLKSSARLVTHQKRGENIKIKLEIADEMPTALHEVEKQQILMALEQTGWHRGKTAEMLGISSSTLYRRLREYDL